MKEINLLIVEHSSAKAGEQMSFLVFPTKFRQLIKLKNRRNLKLSKWLTWTHANRKRDPQDSIDEQFEVFLIFDQ